MKDDCCTTHPDYQAELPRLNRVAGQIEGIKKMIGERRYCPDILAQLRAARAALRTIEASILESHLGACVTDAVKQGNAAEKEAKISEIVNLFKRYEE
ncbi:MAG TPA: metal-sensing transcriptional repressor [Alphaproteobacteria bacterium]